MGKVASVNRVKSREAKKKFDPTIKQIAAKVHGTPGELPSAMKFKGWQASAGSLTDQYGRTWQFQVRAVMQKSEMIKDDSIMPMQGRWTLKYKLQTLVSHFIKWVYSNN